MSTFRRDPKFRKERMRSITPGLLAVTCLATITAPGQASTQQPEQNPIVVLETSLGSIHIELLPNRAPKTVARFLRLVEEGFYDEMLFHRVVRDFVVQTGLLDMHGEIRGEELGPLENEADNGLTNQRGTVAMARLDDPESAKAEFFINVRTNRDLDFRSYRRDEYGFAVFGQVVEGMDIVDAISRIRTRRAGILREFPREPVAIYHAFVLGR